MTKPIPTTDPPLLPPVEEVAQAIVDIAAAMKKMNGTRLRRDAVVILINAHCRVGKPDIRLVLDSLANMDKGMAETTWKEIQFELDDLEGVAQLMCEAGIIGNKSRARVEAKKKKVRKMLKYSAEQGRLS